MTVLSKQKTFYAKKFESILRNYFKCPSKTASGTPFPYFFLQNKANKTGYYRTKERGLSDVFMKYADESSSIVEEKYLTFFPYQNKVSGGFSVGKEHWNNFIKGENKSNENTIWGVFCIDEKHFILAHNKSTFITHNIQITTEQYTFDAVEVQIQNGIYFEAGESLKFGLQWLVTQNKKTILSTPDHNYDARLPDNSMCFPLPRVGQEHLFFIKGEGFVRRTFTEVSNQYHGKLKVDAFSVKLRRLLARNQKQYENNLRMKSIDNIIVIPDDFTEQDFIDWQNEHPKETKRENMAEYMREYRARGVK